jgi:hypothetical protein
LSEDKEVGMLRRKEEKKRKEEDKIPVHVKDVIPSLRIRKGSIYNVPITCGVSSLSATPNRFQ